MIAIGWWVIKYNFSINIFPEKVIINANPYKAVVWTQTQSNVITKSITSTNNRFYKLYKPTNNRWVCTTYALIGITFVSLLTQDGSINNCKTTMTFL